MPFLCIFNIFLIKVKNILRPHNDYVEYYNMIYCDKFDLIELVISRVNGMY